MGSIVKDALKQFSFIDFTTRRKGDKVYNILEYYYFFGFIDCKMEIGSKNMKLRNWKTRWI
ncbi:hypothetical protein HanIR_Chr12g0603051 [Helianthus annuus]|nr:hypothetical protein HanIR_Chr12g0603051 [Helianthus annuus]